MGQLDEVHAEDRELVEKLAKLQKMHQQIADLRGLLPERLLRPTQLALDNPRSVSPERLSASLKKAASDGSMDIQRFKKNFLSPEMRELWQKTDAADFGQGHDAWTVDYQSLIKGSGMNDGVPIAKMNGNAVAEEPTEDEDAIIKQFQVPGSVLKVERASGSNLYPLTITVDRLSFLVTREERDGKRYLSIEHRPGSESSSLETEVIRNVSDKNNYLNLTTVLSMLSSYHDLEFKPCNKCQNIFDDNMKYPLARRRKASTENNSNKIEWDVLHQGCTK